MSYDLVFWTDNRAIRPDPNMVYQALLNEQSVEDLGSFDTSAVLSALRSYFPGFEPGAESTGSAFWEAVDASSVFEFSWSDQHLLATARGRYTNDQMNSIIDVCIEVGGGRLFDPQTGERFDSV